MLEEHDIKTLVFGSVGVLTKEEAWVLYTKTGTIIVKHADDDTFFFSDDHCFGVGTVLQGLFVACSYTVTIDSIEEFLATKSNYLVTFLNTIEEVVKFCNSKKTK